MDYDPRTRRRVSHDVSLCYRVLVGSLFAVIVVCASILYYFEAYRHADKIAENILWRPAKPPPPAEAPVVLPLLAEYDFVRKSLVPPFRPEELELSNLVAVFTTSYGSFGIGLYPSSARKTVTHFQHAIHDEFFEDCGFFLTGSGERKPGPDATLTCSCEQFKETGPSPSVVNEAYLNNVKGTVALALAENELDGSVDFFINLADNTEPFKKTDERAGRPVFGSIVFGWDVVEAIDDALRSGSVKHVRISETYLLFDEKVVSRFILHLTDR